MIVPIESWDHMHIICYLWYAFYNIRHMLLLLGLANIIWKQFGVKTLVKLRRGQSRAKVTVIGPMVILFLSHSFRPWLTNLTIALSATHMMTHSKSSSSVYHILGTMLLRVQVSLLSSTASVFNKWRNWDSKRPNHLTEVTCLLGVTCGQRCIVVWISSTCSFFSLSLIAANCAQ